jgi:PII-like signaling protein
MAMYEQEEPAIHIYTRCSCDLNVVVAIVSTSDKVNYFIDRVEVMIITTTANEVPLQIDGPYLLGFGQKWWWWWWC